MARAGPLRRMHPSTNSEASKSPLPAGGLHVRLRSVRRLLQRTSVVIVRHNYSDNSDFSDSRLLKMSVADDHARPTGHGVVDQPAHQHCGAITTVPVPRGSVFILFHPSVCRLDRHVLRRSVVFWGHDLARTFGFGFGSLSLPSPEISMRLKRVHASFVSTSKASKKEPRAKAA